MEGWRYLFLRFLNNDNLMNIEVNAIHFNDVKL